MEPRVQLDKDEKLYVLDWDAYAQEGKLVYRLKKVSTKDRDMEMVNEYI